MNAGSIRFSMSRSNPVGTHRSLHRHHECTYVRVQNLHVFQLLFFNLNEDNGALHEK